MQKEFIKDATRIVVGAQAEKIAELLDEKNYVNEFHIAKKLDLTINQTRNILYKLSDFGLVSSIRKKDRKKGWYTYFWKAEPEKILNFLKKELEKRIEQFKLQIKSRETKVFYFCERCNLEYTEENALVHNFTCDECGSTFSLKDNSKQIKEMKKIMEKLENELNKVSAEMELEKESNLRKIERESKKSKKKKDTERKRRREEKKGKSKPKKLPAKKIKAKNKKTKKHSSKSKKK